MIAAQLVVMLVDVSTKLVQVALVAVGATSIMLGLLLVAYWLIEQARSK
ncbi:membrane protein [Arthrobacter phage Sicarius2]|uniref:Membrane protein n=1 Tax=Arthrobacter phage Sicarius2 TaxID=2836090 RepID=A0A8F3E629_9CAUD|nr:membrane protein [Arthrobacter phage Sicarius2]